MSTSPPFGTQASVQLICLISPEFFSACTRTPQGKYGCALADGTLLVCGATSMVDPVGSAAGFACVQRGVLLRLSASGDLLSELIFPFSGGAEQPGRREGCMCVTPGEASDDEMVVYVTGYLRSECGYDPSTHEYDDDPMVSNTTQHEWGRVLGDPLGRARARRREA